MRYSHVDEENELSRFIDISLIRRSVHPNQLYYLLSRFKESTYSNTESLLITVRFLSERVNLDDNLFTLLSGRNEDTFPTDSSSSIIVSIERTRCKPTVEGTEEEKGCTYAL